MKPFLLTKDKTKNFVAFDAMMSVRPYRNKLSLEQALEELEKGSGTQFDPKVVKVFKRAQIWKRLF